MVPSQGHVPFSSETGDILCGAPLPVSIHWAPLHVKRCDFLEETASNIFLCRRGQPLSFNEPPFSRNGSMPHTVRWTWRPQTERAHSHDIKGIILESLLWIPWVLSCIIFLHWTLLYAPIFLQFHYISFVLNILIFKIFSNIWTILHKYDNYIFLFYKGNVTRLDKSIQ